MKKELPGLFANKIDKPLYNNKKVAVSKHEDREDKIEVKSPIVFEKNINQKIKEIFDSPKYVYKVDVLITMKDKKITKKIVGKNRNNLITIDNELISINDILDIEFANKS